MTATHPTTAPVVLATDGTAGSDGALRYAVEQARKCRAELRILHVMPMAVPVPPLRPVEPTDLEPYARNVLSRSAKHARDLAPGLAVSTMIAHGGRVRGIVNGSADAQLVVVGRETSHGFGRLLTGATTAGVASNARCPVVVVPGDWRPRSNAEGGGTVVVGIRRPDDASHLMGAAYAEAMSLGATITVVHAWELPDPYIDSIEARSHSDEWQGLGEHLLNEALGDLARPVPPPLDREPGSPRPRCERPRVRGEGGRPCRRASGPRAPSVRPPRGHRPRVAAGQPGAGRGRACPGSHPRWRCRDMIRERGGPIRVFLLDDHEIVRRGIKELLEGEGDIEVVGESGLAQEAARRIPALRPDVAILDGRLPDGSGIDVCRQVRSVDPTIAGLILTSYDDDDALFAAIMAGAAGYILKQVGGSDLVETVRRVAAGQSTLDPSVTARVLDRLRNGPRADPELAALSAQEQRILELIGEGLTNREIAERMYLAEKTVKNYVSSMLAKLSLTSRTQAAIFATKHPHT